MIACISPAPGSIEESLHTLNYAARARNIRSKVSRTIREVGKDVIQGL
jgi:hypothetical protein